MGIGRIRFRGFRRLHTSCVTRTRFISDAEQTMQERDRLYFDGSERVADKRFETVQQSYNLKIINNNNKSMFVRFLYKNMQLVPITF